MGEVPGSIPGTALLRSEHASAFSPRKSGSGVVPAQVSTTVLVARLAQLVERKALNLVVVGSSPTVGTSFSEWVFLVVNGRPPLRASVVGQRLLAAGMHITI